MNHQLIILSGPSAVGKNTIIDKLITMQPLARFETPITTRKARKNEKNKKEYFFITKEEFKKQIKANKIYEWDYTLKNYYGFYSSIVDDSKMPIVITHALAKMAVRLKYNHKNVTLVYIEPSSDKTIIDRLKSREDINDLNERIEHGKDEAEHKDLFDVIFTNDDLEQLAKNIINHITKLQGKV